jgi:hypothetical protein
MSRKLSERFINNLSSEEYLRQYVKYMVWVKHRPIPRNVLRDVPFDIKIMLLSEWNRQMREFNRKRMMRYGRI